MSNMLRSIRRANYRAKYGPRFWTAWKRDMEAAEYRAVKDFHNSRKGAKGKSK